MIFRDQRSPPPVAEDNDGLGHVDDDDVEEEEEDHVDDSDVDYNDGHVDDDDVEEEDHVDDIDISDIWS